jgi:predicted phage terminase large subunit-like protein
MGILALSDSKWSVIYERAIRDDGSLFFPERLSKEFLEQARRSQGSYIFANQYQNEIIPLEDQTFKPEWIRYYKELPAKKYTFAFIDPAISEAATADYTALTVIDVDPDKNWYIRNSTRYKINPTKIINLIFKVHEQFKPKIIGIEDVAYQKALLYMVDEEMRRRNVIVPVKGIRPDPEKSKEMRILGLVPRFEFGHMMLAQGLKDFEDEYAQFPRAKHDDLLDSLSYCDKIVYYPEKYERNANEPPAPNSPEYERWYIANIHKQRTQQRGGPDS